MKAGVIETSRCILRPLTDLIFGSVVLLRAINLAGPQNESQPSQDGLSWLRLRSQLDGLFGQSNCLKHFSFVGDHVL